MENDVDQSTLEYDSLHSLRLKIVSPVLTWTNCIGSSCQMSRRGPINFREERAAQWVDRKSLRLGFFHWNRCFSNPVYFKVWKALTVTIIEHLSYSRIFRSTIFYLFVGLLIQTSITQPSVTHPILDMISRKLIQKKKMKRKY